VVTSLSLRCYAPSGKGHNSTGKVKLPHYEILDIPVTLFIVVVYTPEFTPREPFRVGAIIHPYVGAVIHP